MGLLCASMRALIRMRMFCKKASNHLQQFSADQFIF